MHIQPAETTTPVPLTLYTVSEVCDILKVSKETLYRRMASGALPYIYLSRRIRRIRQSDLIKFVNEARYGKEETT